MSGRGDGKEVKARQGPVDRATPRGTAWGQRGTLRRCSEGGWGPAAKVLGEESRVGGEVSQERLRTERRRG